MAENYDRAYFEGIGYKGLYRDFPVHYITVGEVLKRKPESILEIGCGRGYLVKLFENAGIRTVGMDVSPHCYHTRATDSFVLHDATVFPWEFKDKEFDVCFSIAFMEHLPSEDKVADVIKESARVSKRGLHGITFQIAPNDTDPTHKSGTIRPKEWWQNKFKEVVPDYPVEIVDKEDLERGPVDIAKYAPPDGLEKWNIGSFIDCFHYGWINADSQDLSQWARQNGYVFRQVDVTKGIPKPDSSIDIILNSHFLEHLDRPQGEAFLRECYRVLKPNGLLRTVVPDAKLLAKKYLKGEIMEYGHVNVGVENAPDSAEALFHLLLAGHKTIYDYEALQKLLEKTGFKNVKKTGPFESQLEAIKKQTVSSYPTLSIYVESSKPDVKPTYSVPTTPKDKLKIGFISTRFFSCPPKGYSGLEMVVWDLAVALAKRGHFIRLFAPEGSQAPPNGELVITGSALKTVGVDWLKAEQEAYKVYKDHLSDLDVIHGNNWFGHEYLAKANNQSLKVCHTHHGGLNLDYWGKSKPPFKLNLIGISRWMADVYRNQGFEARYCYNGVDIEKYGFNKEHGDSLLFVGRLDSFKQPHLAIEVAKRLNMELDVVGGSFVQDPAYLEQIKRMCDGRQIRLHLDASHEEKIELMQNAGILLFPSQMGEPFGLVAVEAMACGCRVVALNDGAIEEVVREGGFTCDVFEKTYSPEKRTMSYTIKKDLVAALAEGVKLVSPIKAEDCRTNAARFSRENMALGYEKLYYSILAGEEW